MFVGHNMYKRYSHNIRSTMARKITETIYKSSGQGYLKLFMPEDSDK